MTQHLLSTTHGSIHHRRSKDRLIAKVTSIQPTGSLSIDLSEYLVALRLLSSRCRLHVPRKQTSEPLDEHHLSHKSGPLRQAGDAESSHSEDIVQHDAREDVEDDIDESQTKVPPSLAVVHVARRQELVGRPDRTILAPTRGAGVEQAPRSALFEEPGQVSLAGLA